MGEVEGAYKVDLKLEGEVVHSEDVTLEGGETKEVPLWIREGLPEGTYHVEVNGLKGSFEVVRAAKPVGGGLTNLVPQAIILSLILLTGFLLLLRFALNRWIRYGDM